jgi:hypothetical protein
VRGVDPVGLVQRRNDRAGRRPDRAQHDTELLAERVEVVAGVDHEQDAVGVADRLQRGSKRGHRPVSDAVDESDRVRDQRPPSAEGGLGRRRRDGPERPVGDRARGVGIEDVAVDTAAIVVGTAAVVRLGEPPAEPRLSGVRVSRRDDEIKPGRSTLRSPL